MDDLVQAVVDEVLRRQGQRPALLVGRAPQAAAGWRFVTDGPYEAVILGSLTAAELLRFPDEASAQALLEGKPVYYCPARCGPRKKAPPSRGRACCACAAARRNTSRRTLSARGRATGSSSPSARRRARGGRTCP